MATVTADLDRRRLLIQADSYEEGNVLRALPTRKWLPTKGVFIVPLTRMNARQLVDAIGRGALHHIGTHTSDLLEGIANPPHNARQWPSDFPFRQTPYPDQLAAAQKCYNNDVFALFMRPGSGKSKVAIDMVAKHWGDGRIKLVIVVCPLTVAPVWIYNELQKHTPTGITWRVGLFGNKEYQTNTAGPPDIEWWVVGVESLSQGTTAARLLAAIEKDKRPYAVIVDESHTIKTHTAIRSKRVIDLGKGATVRGIMTGTATTRSLIDLYNQFEFLDPDIIGIGDWFAFRNRYCVMGGYKQKEIVAYDNVEELMGLIEPYTYRCDKPKGLPEKRFDERLLTMPAAQREMYEKVRNAEVPEIKVANILNRIGKLQQVAGGFLRSDPKEGIHPITGRKVKVPGEVIWTLEPHENPKLRALDDIMQGASDQQVIVWCRYLWEVEQVYGLLSGYGETAKLVGSTTVEERAQIQENFQAGSIRHIVGNQQTGGIGITLTASHLHLFYSNTYSFVDRTQAEDRSHRIGQHNDVLYIDLLLKKSVDNVIKAAIMEKLDLDAYIARKLDEAQGNTKLLKETLGEIL